MDLYPVLRISLLGGFKVVAGDKPLTTINTPRLQALLAYLLLHRDAPQPRQHIAFLFWPDSSEEQAQTNLRNLLLVLRRAFPDVERYISIERRSLQWRKDSHFDLDVIDFEEGLAGAEHELRVARQTVDSPHDSVGNPSTRPSSKLQEAVDFYTGDLLPSCYDEWVLAPRERLRQGFLWVLSALISALEVDGELTTAALYAQRLIRHDPLQEENYRRLMRLHLGMADRAGVVNVYRQCERVLRREFEVEPSEATRQLVRRAEELSGRDDAPKGSRAKGRGPARAPGNLPAQTATFIGREREVTEVSKLLRLPGYRLVTLTGTAGTGKTRLAIQAASGLGQFKDGIFFVSLAPLTEPEMVEHSILQAFGLTEAANRHPRNSLLEYLRDKQILLVLDNFEHLLPAATLVAELLTSCPYVKVLATSRSPLNLRGEHEYPVPPMSVPGRDAPHEPDDLAQYETVALFVERALEVSPQFALKRGNARAVAEICRRLEGLPLAIELAAARIKALTPETILARLDRRLKLLVGGRQDLPPRQLTLETAIAWSYNLLDDEEKRLFRGLSIFAGSCSLEAVEEVLGGSEPRMDTRTMLEGITALLNKSLLSRMDAGSEHTEAGDEARYCMLETLREYGLERLSESGERYVVARRHALYFARLAETASAKFYAPGQVDLFERVEQEHDNIRAALRWACEVEEGEIATRLAGSLDRFWERRGHLTEGRAWLERALTIESTGAYPKDGDRSPHEKAQAQTARANTLRGLGRFQLRLGEYASAEATLKESISLFESVGHKEGTADALNVMAVAVGMNEFDRGLELHERCLAIRREIGDRWGIVASLQNMATIKVSQGKFAEACSLCNEALDIQRGEGGSDSKAAILFALGAATLGLGDYAEGERILEECVALCRELKNNRLMGWALHELAASAYAQGDYEQSRRLNAESLELFSEQGARPGIAHALVRLGRDAHHLGNYDEARQLYLQALSRGMEIRLQPVLGQSLAGLAGVAASRGRSREAAMLFGSAQGILARIYSSLEREAMTLNMEEARAALGEEAWHAAWAEGYALTPEQAARIAQHLS